MKPKPAFYFTTDQATRFDRDGKVLIPRLIEQPPNNMPHMKILFGNTVVFSEEQEPFNSKWTKLRYPSSKYAAWMPKPYGWYQWGTPTSSGVVPTKTSAILTVKTSVKRVSELIDDEIKLSLPRDILDGDVAPLMNAPDKRLRKFIANWNARHARPSKTVDGKGYECFPYDETYYRYITNIHDICAKYLTEEHVGKLRYKGKPLTIYADPWIELNEVERRKS